MAVFFMAWSYELENATFVGAQCKKDPVNLFCLCGDNLLMSDERQRKERVLQIELVKPRHSRFLQTKMRPLGRFFVLKRWEYSSRRYYTVYSDNFGRSKLYSHSRFYKRCYGDNIQYHRRRFFAKENKKNLFCNINRYFYNRGMLVVVLRGVIPQIHANGCNYYDVFSYLYTLVCCLA